jgi:hypothetical protein
MSASLIGRGTRITPRPPHRSRRALLTHRALPLGRTPATRGLKPHALQRTAANRIDVVSRLSVRTTAACRPFPFLPGPAIGQFVLLADSHLVLAPRLYGCARHKLRADLPHGWKIFFERLQGFGILLVSLGSGAHMGEAQLLQSPIDRPRAATLPINCFSQSCIWQS